MADDVADAPALSSKTGRPVKLSLAESGVFMSDDPRSLNSTRYDDIFDDLKADIPGDMETEGKILVLICTCNTRSNLLSIIVNNIVLFVGV